MVLNVNVPHRPFEELAGVRWCRQSMQILDDRYDSREDPRGKPYYWLAGAGRLDGEGKDDDLTLLTQGFVTVTPLSIDWTHRELLGGGGAKYLTRLEGELGTSG